MAQATWKALNIDYEVETDEEVIDDTKEIQVEEALKLYQTALKLHSEGPKSYAQAAAAYRELFKSEIFSYPESLSEFARLELYGHVLEYDSLVLDEPEAGPVQLPGASNDAPNTLAQLLHLSYKNHGEFLLDLLEYQLREHFGLQQERNDTITPKQIAAASDAPLRYFSEALDKDDVDLDLWRRTSRVARFVGSKRMARYCLEAVLDGDDEAVDSILRLPGLEQGIAAQELRELVEGLRDDVSRLQAPLSNLKRQNLSMKVKKSLELYPSIPLPSEGSEEAIAQSVLGQPPTRLVLTPSKPDWTSVGEAILQQYFAGQGGFMNNVGPSPRIVIKLPESLPTQDQQAQAAEPNQPKTHGTQQSLPENAGEVSAERQPRDKSVPAVNEDTQMQEANAERSQEDTSARVEGQEDPATMQPRKRSTESAGLPETADGGRARSKRIRARESIVDATNAVDGLAPDHTKQREAQLASFEHADRWLFVMVDGLLGKLGVNAFGTSESLRDTINNETNGSIADPDPRLRTAIRDLYDFLQQCPPQAAATLLHGEGIDALAGISREARLNTFVGDAKSGSSCLPSSPLLSEQGVMELVSQINDEWMTTKEVAWTWVERLLRRGAFPTYDGLPNPLGSSYLMHRWAENLKRIVVQIIVNLDEYIFQRVSDDLTRLGSAAVHSKDRDQPRALRIELSSLIDMAQTLFELHLDVYSLIRHPGSGVDAVTQMLQKDRLERWAALSRDAINVIATGKSGRDFEELCLRHIWASVFHIGVCDDISQQHVIHFMGELKAMVHSWEERHLADMDKQIVQLQNNAVMPELSVTAVDRELAAINMRDFFLKVFDHDEKDPVAVIENLEPLLEISSAANAPDISDTDENYQGADEASDSGISIVDRASNASSHAHPAARPTPLHEMTKFVENANVSLRLSMWHRLSQAYEAIDYPPKVVSCSLRSIEILMTETTSPSYQNTPSEQRIFMLLRWFRFIDQLTYRALTIARTNKTAFECLDDEHVRSSLSALAAFLRVVHTLNIYEDYVRVGQLPPPTFEGRQSTVFPVIVSKLHDVQIRTWELQYLLLKDGMKQNQGTFTNPVIDQIEYLRHVHHAVGIRGFLQASNRSFLRLLKEEILHIADESAADLRDAELSQLLYDMYGLKCHMNAYDCMEYGCPPEALDKKTALQLLDFIMAQARKIGMKDLPKSELKDAIIKVHGALGKPKANEGLAMNRSIYAAYWKSPINPLDLFRALEGMGSLSTKPISPQQAPAASKGWFFLMGLINLHKFRSQKRVVPGPIDDLNVAAAFFAQDLEYSEERWETWYRLAQCHDLQLEDITAWTAEKVNSNNHEVIQYQRSAIHCYTMAVACAVRAAEVDADFDADGKVAELYSDFGTRMYASSREPFSMHAFEIKESEKRYYSGAMMYQGAPFKTLDQYSAWKFASVLFRKAILKKPDYWWNHYMLGKCLWKMHTADPQLRGRSKPVDGRAVIESFTQAIETVPERKDGRREPILEPHYKLVSIVHKIVGTRGLTLEHAGEVLQTTRYARKVGPPTDFDDWDEYVLQLLKNLRNADKSGWHHRMAVRAAHVIYDNSGNDPMAARAAKHELTQQIFTKTMAIQVWKPEHERPGRHFVYTTRYTRFFLQLLVQLDDRPNLEVLARRVRRKPHEFFDHGKLWQDVCGAYIKLLRRTGKIPEGNEDIVFKSLSHDEFVPRASRLEAWAQSPDTKDPLLDVLRDALELKRLNAKLMKDTLFDDLIGDTYATLYETHSGASRHRPTFPAPRRNVPHAPHERRRPVRGTTPPRPNILGNPFAPQQPELSSTTAKPRAKTVGRRELARRAEAAVTKTAPLKEAMPLRPTPAEHPKVVIPGRRTSLNTGASAGEAERGGEGLGAGAAGDITGLAPPLPTAADMSAPGSVHDSADDESESELSELEEEAVVRPMFPGLVAVRAVADEAADTEEEGEGEAEAEAEEEGNEEGESDAETPDMSGTDEGGAVDVGGGLEGRDGG
ncbi:Histone transcription regulator 3 [Coniosporium tulheliwenetii]|uniref:Histone transcription regulator 3 n=1 Tax=Coniosporium tulheliwenetii TaxID=3383036 RepID=A0ACC2ZG38_9PEZI|nr:Histone transcription regulator 3 [Cladosporium sp. JES 115]